MSGRLTTLHVSAVATLALLVMALVPALTRGASPAERLTGSAFVVLAVGWLVVVALVNGGADRRRRGAALGRGLALGTIGATLALPVDPGRTGTRAFCADDSGAVRFSPDGTLPPVAGPGCPSLEEVR